MMLVRGVTEVKGMALSSVASAAISGIAGIGLILVAVGLLFLLHGLKKAAELATAIDINWPGS